MAKRGKNKNSNINYMKNYTINKNNKKYKVNLECFLLYNSWSDKTFIKKFNKSNKKVFEEYNQDIIYDNNNPINIELIQLNSYEGICMITPMKDKNNIAHKSLNDIWTNNNMLVWCFNYNTKFNILEYRSKHIKSNKLKNNKKTIKKYNKTEINKMDFYSVYLSNLLTNTKLHNNINKNPYLYKNYQEDFFKKKYEKNTNIFGKITENKLYLIIPPKPQKYNINDVINISECITDILYNDGGNITMIWSSEIKDYVKNFRHKD